MSSTCFELEVTSSECKHVNMKHLNIFYHTCTYNCLPEDEPLGSKHVEDIVKINILV